MQLFAVSIGGLVMNSGTISCGFGRDIFFLSPLSRSLLKDVLECTTQAFPVFPCGPSAAAGIGSPSSLAAGVSLQPTRESPPLLQHVPSDFAEHRNLNHFFFLNRRKCLKDI